MRRKFLIKLIASAVLGSVFTIGASAAEIDVDFENEQFVVTGEISSKKSGEAVKLMVLNPDKTLDDAMGDGFGEAIQYVADAVTEENGKYSFFVPVLTAEDTAGYFTFYIGTVDEPESEMLTKYYSTAHFRTDVIKAINNADKSTIEQALSDSIEPLSLNFEAFEKGDLSKIAELVYKDKEKKEYDEEDFGTTQQRIKELALLSAYNESLSSVVYGADGALKHQNIIDISAIDSDGVTLYSAYENIITEKARSDVRKALLDKDFETVEDLYDTFSEAVFVHGVKSANTEGTGHIASVLTKKNADAAGVSLTKYLNVTNKSKKGIIESKLLTESFSTPQELVEKLNEIIEDVMDSQSGSGSGSGNGRGSSTGTSSMVPIVSDSAVNNTTESKKEYFTDLNNVEWAKEAINYLYEKKIVNGTGEDTFSPDNKITREQFAVILVNASGYELGGEDSSFADVVEDAYYEKHVLTAKSLGIVNGISENEFGVGKTITRQDLCVMIYRAWFDGKTGSDMSFKDKDSVSDYSKAAVGYLSSKGIINGFEDNTFKPQQACTRAQAAKIIYEAMKLR